MINKIVFIVGPTAVGKSEIALAVAERVGGEIVSCDSMQVYREIRIANNRPSDDGLRRVPHHLVGFLSVTEDYDVAAFNRMANAAIVDIQSRGRVPVVAGGSGMYMQILLDGIFEDRSQDGGCREELSLLADEKGLAFLYEQLRSQDPQAASKVHPNDRRRLIRALEICLTHDRPATEAQKERRGLWGKQPIDIFCLNLDREELYERINQRVDAMFAAGLLEEIKSLAGIKLSRTAGSLIGIPELQAYFRGEHDLEAAKILMKMHTRQFAKRQLTWFRKEKRAQWIELGKDKPIAVAVKTISEF
ncbi:MAG: tRNA (adenosine(37)-N6)-dimethylallyltransferase MiaA [Candidatus Omnitrophica bacterium]|nr:tRNA (adenosine(37)-N6)-dimethylallyltransferase MiaA [Candidatus Omnitrophota bacterium]